MTGMGEIATIGDPDSLARTFPQALRNPDAYHSPPQTVTTCLRRRSAFPAGAFALLACR